MSDLTQQEFADNIRSMNAESEKFIAEQRKLIAESQKLDRDRLLAPWLTIVGIVGGVVTISSLIMRVLGIIL